MKKLLDKHHLILTNTSILVDSGFNSLFGFGKCVDIYLYLLDHL